MAINVCGCKQDGLVNSIEKEITVNVKNTGSNTNHMLVSVLGTVQTAMIAAKLNSVDSTIVRVSGTGHVELCGGTGVVTTAFKTVRLRFVKDKVMLYLDDALQCVARVLASDISGTGAILCCGVNSSGGTEGVNIAFENFSIRQFSNKMRLER